MKRYFFVLCVILAAGLPACGSRESDKTWTQSRHSITGNAGAVVLSEDVLVNQGRYQEVMLIRVRKNSVDWGGCTGTVIAPYTVLTAAHCRGSLSDYRPDRFVEWKGIKLPIQNDFTNPFAANLKYYRFLNIPIPHGRQNGHDEERPFAPQWYLDALGVQRTDPAMLPHMHDSHLFFVPKLTPDFIAQHQIRVAQVDAFAFVRPLDPGYSYKTYRGVGVGSTGGKERRSVNYKLRDPIHRKGFLTIEPNAAGFGRPDFGDSGGPVFGQLWFYGTEHIYTPNVLLGTHQNLDDLVPLAYHPSAPANNNPETADTIRRNHLWVMARMHDIENDGITDFCDPDPARTNVANQNQCPAPVGSPQGWATHGYPKGLLMCARNEYVAGARGSYSFNGVIHLALLCRPKTCLDNGGNCPSEYWTDTYGADPKPDGDNFVVQEHSARCGEKRAISEMHFELANDEIFYIKPICTNFPVGNNAAFLPPFGRRTYKLDVRKCPTGEHIVGVVAHNRTFKRISGMQIICSGALK